MKKLESLLIWILVLFSFSACDKDQYPNSDGFQCSNTNQLIACHFPPLYQISYNELDITNGSSDITEMENGWLSISQPQCRATVDNRRVFSYYGGILFKYHGPSIVDKPLASGSVPRQIGLKLRSNNGCNLMYVMWVKEPEEKLAVSVKSNPGMVSSSQCGANGYYSLTPDWTSSTFPPINSGKDGECHSLTAEIVPIWPGEGTRGDDFKLIICADDVAVWEGTIFDLPIDVKGVSGFRTDNGSYDFKLFTDINKGSNSWLISYSGTSFWDQSRVADNILSELNFGDFNGDGFTDVFRSANGKWQVSLEGKSDWVDWKTSSVSIENLAFADFDGDGKTDVFTTINGKWQISLEGKSNWIDWKSSNTSLENLAFADFDGDAKADVFRTSNGKWQVSLSGKSNWIDWKTSSTSIENLAFADFDGDGKSDVFRTSNGKWQISLEGKSDWIDWKTSNTSLENLAFADFDGDGKADVFRTSNGKWYVSFEGKTNWNEWNQSNSKLGELAFGDFDGDGESDVFRSSRK